MRSSLLLLTLLASQTAWAQDPEGCQLPAAEVGDFEHAQIRADETHSVIRVYLTQSFLDMDQPFGLRPDVARDIIQQWLPEVQAQTGVAFRLELGGIGGEQLCCPPDHPDPACTDWTRPGITIEESLTPTGGNAHAQRRASGELHCGTIRIENRPVVACDRARFPETGCRETARCTDEGMCQPIRPVLAFRAMLWHALMRLLNHAHHRDPLRCPDHLEDETVIAGPGDLLYQGPSAADVRALRSAYGDRAYPVAGSHTNGFDTDISWSETPVQIQTEQGAIGPAATFDTDQNAPGWVHPIRHALARWAGEVRATLYMEDLPTDRWQVQRVSDARIYHSPVIARSRGVMPNCWLVGMWVGDTRTSAGKSLYFRQKIAGETDWHWGGTLDLDVTRVDGLGLTFDPLTQRFVVAYINDDFQVEVRTRMLASTTWSEPVSTGFEAPVWSGGDIACSPVDDDRGNCMLVGLTADASDPGIQAWLFRIDPAGDAVFDADPVSMGPWNTRRATTPTITSNPQDDDPQFILGYELGGGDDGADERLYLMTFDRGADGFAEHGHTQVLPAERFWGAPLGSHVYRGGGFLSLIGPF